MGVGLVLLLLLLAPSTARSDDEFWAMSRPADIMFEPTLGVGPESIVQLGNCRVMAYDRSGQEQWRALLSSDPEFEIQPGNPGAFSDNYFWEYPDGTPLPGNGGADVRVLYDQFASRFIVMSMGLSEVHLYLAVSKDSTPEGYDHVHWDKFYIEIEGSPNPPTGARFHFGGLAVNEEAIYITSILDWDHAVQILERPPPPPWEYDPEFYTIAGNHRQIWILPPYPDPDPHAPGQIRLPMPAHFLGPMSPETMYLVQLTARGVPVPQPDPAQLRITAIDPNAHPEPTLTHFALTLNVPGGTPLYQHLSQICPSEFPVQRWDNIQNVVWRGGHLYFARIHAHSDAYPARFVAHWYDVHTHDWPHGNSVPAIEQDGIIDGGRIFIDDDPDNDRPVNCIYPLVMPTARGDLGIFFSRYHAYGYMDLCWAAHRSDDPAGWMGTPVSLMMDGPAGVDNPAHWGDYEGIALDPQDASRVWSTGETGRCTPGTPCEPCEAGGESQGSFHSVIGSYTVPQEPTRSLTIEFRVEGRPPQVLCHVKVMPPDAAGQADAFLTGAAPTETRWYGHGSVVILRAPDLSAHHLEFDRWEVGQTPNGPSLPRQINVTMSADLTATAWYTAE